MAEPVRVEPRTYPVAIVGDAYDDRASSWSIRHAGHFRRQLVGSMLVGRLARENGSSGTPPAPLLLDVHPLHFDAFGRLASR